MKKDLLNVVLATMLVLPVFIGVSMNSIGIVGCTAAYITIVAGAAYFVKPFRKWCSRAMRSAIRLHIRLWNTI